MDSTLIAAIIGTLGGGLVTGAAAVLRTRIGVRTAARLIYAELTRDCGAVVYFRRTDHWAATNLSRTAWDEHSEVLARRRSGASFETVHQGYEALEMVPIIAENSLPLAERREWIDKEAKRLAAAIKEAGAIAQVPEREIRSWTRKLVGPVLARRTPHPLVRSGSVSSLVVLGRVIEDDAAGFAGAGVRLLAEGPLPLPDAPFVADVVVFDAEHSERMQDLKVVRYTGVPPVGDPMVDETYDALVAVRRFFREVYGRVTLPVTGRPLAATVHYGENYANAWWDGYSLFLGDGDGVIFGRFSKCPEVIATEVTRGLEELLYFTSYQGENGALGGSVCDVFGILVKQWSLGQTADEADWILGAGLLAPGRQGVGLRSVSAPGTAYDDNILGVDPQVGHMDDYVVTEADNGGIHINSGIPSRAFHLLATSLGGRAWERAGQIWWDALTGDGLRDGLLFADWARLTAGAARERYGEDSVEERAVLAAWSDVGVTPAPERTDD